MVADHTGTQIAAHVAGAIENALKDLNMLIYTAQKEYGLTTTVGIHEVDSPVTGRRQQLFAEYSLTIKPERMQE